MRLYAIGDIHGCAQLLEILHAKIRAEILRDHVADFRIIHLGDHCDRGPDTRGVIEQLVAAQQSDPRTISLIGNHDAGFLDFLKDPKPYELFTGYGGDQTLRSYGIEADLVIEPERIRARDELLKIMPQSHRLFLEELRYSVSFGDYFFCHAGIRPGIPLDQQDEFDLIWIRKEFIFSEQPHPKVIVHGHTPVTVPALKNNRIDVDTRAFKSGILTAVVLDGSDIRFIDTEGS